MLARPESQGCKLLVVFEELGPIFVFVPPDMDCPPARATNTWAPGGLHKQKGGITSTGFSSGQGVEHVLEPDRSSQISGRAALATAPPPGSKASPRVTTLHWTPRLLRPHLFAFDSPFNQVKTSAIGMTLRSDAHAPIFSPQGIHSVLRIDLPRL
ncbi:hypothetical protein PoB_004733100 [Plakobranchus ocellatus]|uniref:Uncharacterized protein n=1 Tax=Plakobranchus ocellatus TaxID=259542 RepID=A0AAV4BK94_9GAST|nr:hypothetical protein PoB_004733100 [Plakobranchus ocellatus]